MINNSNIYSSQLKENQRKGKWTYEEYEYAKKIIEYFKIGMIDFPSLSTGVTLRSYLAEKLDCDPIRITKKFAGELSLGKKVYFNDFEKIPLEESTKMLEEMYSLKKNFDEKVIQTSRYELSKLSSIDDFSKNCDANSSALTNALRAFVPTNISSQPNQQITASQLFPTFESPTYHNDMSLEEFDFFSQDMMRPISPIEMNVVTSAPGMSSVWASMSIHPYNNANMDQNMNQDMIQSMNKKTDQYMNLNTFQNSYINKDQNVNQNMSQNSHLNMTQNRFQNINQNMNINNSQNVNLNMNQNINLKMGQTQIDYQAGMRVQTVPLVTLCGILQEIDFPTALTRCPDLRSKQSFESDDGLVLLQSDLQPHSATGTDDCGYFVLGAF